MKQWQDRVLLVLVGATVTAACGAIQGGPGADTPTSSSSTRPSVTTKHAGDPETTAELLKVAQNFNTDYEVGRYGAVYDRWDSASKAIISRDEYIRRRRDCGPAPDAPVKVLSASPGQSGVWLVRYDLAGVILTDTWLFQSNRWVFDITSSNPTAAKAYAEPFAQYATTTGCHG